MFGFRFAYNSIYDSSGCKAILSVYAEDITQILVELEQWQAAAERFTTKWKFHYTSDVLDGKHATIWCPRNSGSVCFNYKK